MKKLSIIASLLLVVGCSGSAVMQPQLENPVPPKQVLVQPDKAIDKPVELLDVSVPDELVEREFDAKTIVESAQTGKPIILFYYLPECGYCSEMKSEVWKDKEVIYLTNKYAIYIPMNITEHLELYKAHLEQTEMEPLVPLTIIVLPMLLPDQNEPGKIYADMSMMIPMPGALPRSVMLDILREIRDAHEEDDSDKDPKTEDNSESVPPS